MYLPLVVHRYQMEAAIKLLQSKNRVLFTLVSPVGHVGALRGMAPPSKVC